MRTPPSRWGRPGRPATSVRWPGATGRPRPGRAKTCRGLLYEILSNNVMAMAVSPGVTLDQVGLGHAITDENIFVIYMKNIIYKVK